MMDLRHSFCLAVMARFVRTWLPVHPFTLTAVCWNATDVRRWNLTNEAADVLEYPIISNSRLCRYEMKTSELTDTKWPFPTIILNRGKAVISVWLAVAWARHPQQFWFCSWIRQVPDFEFLPLTSTMAHLLRWEIEQCLFLCVFVCRRCRRSY